MAKDSSLISDIMVEEITKFVHDKLKDKKRRAISMPEIYDAHLGIIGDVDRVKFLNSLSAAVHEGRIKGFEMKRGKNGGVGFADSKVTEVTEVTESANAPETEVTDMEPLSFGTPPVPKLSLTESTNPVFDGIPDFNTVTNPVFSDTSPTLPVVKQIPTVPKEECCSITIGERTYKISCSYMKVKSILIHVFESKEDPNGDIVFDGKKYTCKDKYGRQYFDNFLYFVLGASYEEIWELPDRHHVKSA